MRTKIGCRTVPMMEVPPLAVWVAAAKNISGLSSEPGRIPGCRRVGTGGHALGPDQLPPQLSRAALWPRPHRPSRREQSGRATDDQRAAPGNPEKRQQDPRDRAGSSLASVHRALAWLARCIASIILVLQLLVRKIPKLPARRPRDRRLAGIDAVASATTARSRRRQRLRSTAVPTCGAGRMRPALSRLSPP